MTMGSKFAIATASAEREGYHTFTKGSAGEKERKRIAEGIAKGNKIVPGPAKKGKHK